MGLRQDINYENLRASQFANTIFLSTKDKVCQLFLSVYMPFETMLY